MSRISNSSFKVNSDLQQEIEISSVAGGVTLPVSLSASQLNTTANVAYVGGTAISLGSKAGSASLPVVVASDQVLNVDLDSVAGSALALGSTVSGSSIPVVIASDQIVNVDLDAINGSTLNIGQQLKNASIPVTLASNEEALAITKETNAGSHGNMDNSSSVFTNDVSTKITVDKKSNITIFGETTDTTNGIKVQVSADDTNYYDMSFQIWPNSSGDFFEKINGVAVNYIRLEYQGNATVTATCLSSA